MNTPPENDFAELRRLLSVKRHEQPPPGYFNNFSREVIASLKAERSRPTRSARSADGPLWIVSFLERLQARPALSGALGAGLCALAIGGIVLNEGNTRPPSLMPSLLSEVTTGAQPAVDAETLGMTLAPAFQPVMANSPTILVASNNLQSSPNPTLFDSFPGLDTAPVGYR